jgi:hypothetical protein
MLVHIALQFITLGTSEAGRGRLLSSERAIQGQYGTSYRTDMLRARFSLHVNRKVGKNSSQTMMTQWEFLRSGLDNPFKKFTE